ncbi:hypothetical protein DFAR_1650011 [Desulfarculales bacterium]
MPPLLGFCGASNSGKTTLLSQVVAELSRRGLAVGVSHHGHRRPYPCPASRARTPAATSGQAGGWPSTPARYA